MSFSKIYWMKVAYSRWYISLCTKAYKCVIIFYMCVNMVKRIRMNISLTKEENTLIKKLAKEEERPYSRQIVYMMNFYIKNNKIKEEE
jgi:hypothetical protein